jgi:hypothetical protein
MSNVAAPRIKIPGSHAESFAEVGLWEVQGVRGWELTNADGSVYLLPQRSAAPRCVKVARQRAKCGAEPHRVAATSNVNQQCKILLLLLKSLFGR